MSVVRIREGPYYRGFLKILGSLSTDVVSRERQPEVDLFSFDAF